ncbi:MAG: DMT family transporter [Desulfosarcinaceae bacterium]|nr:DMT family transporter [Desulfosarcinaceae bacterium]
MADRKKGGNHPQHRALVAVHLAVVLFGLSGLFGKFLSLTPLTIVFGRTAWASLALIALLAVRGEIRLPHRPDRALLVLSGAILVAHWYTFFASIQVSSVAVGLVTFSSFPLFVTLLEPLCFREPLRRRDLATALLVVLGLLLVVPSYSFANRITLGAFWGTCSGASFAILALMNRRFRRHNATLPIAAAQNSVAAVLLLPVVWRGGLHLRGNDFISLMFLGIVCTALAHALFISGLARIRAQTASVLAGLEPVYGIAFAYLLLGERPSLRTLLGGGVILTAVILASRKEAAIDGSV